MAGDEAGRSAKSRAVPVCRDGDSEGCRVGWRLEAQEDARYAACLDAWNEQSDVRGRLAGGVDHDLACRQSRIFVSDVGES